MYCIAAGMSEVESQRQSRAQVQTLLQARLVAVRDCDQQDEGGKWLQMLLERQRHDVCKSRSCLHNCLVAY